MPSESTSSRFDAVLTDLAIALALAVGIAAPVYSQEFPARPISIVLSAAAGGPSDVPLRLLLPKLSELLGKPVIIEPRPGGNGNIAGGFVKQAPPDGYTLLDGHLATIALGPLVIKDMPYDPQKDFKPITIINELPTFLTVPASSPAHSVADLVKLAGEKPGGLFFASQGTGTASHLMSEMFKERTKLPMTLVNYKGGAPAILDLIRGSVDFSFSSFAAIAPHVQSGRLRILAVAAAQRSPIAPGIPTMAEAGYPGLEMNYWFGLFAPAGTPDAVIKVLYEAFAKALASDETKAAFAKQGMTPGGMPPAQFARRIEEDRRRLLPIIQAAGILPK
jgi:tripartite-type tricarboxylate transporter receptor subunit TctC